ncbi:MAG: 50S ribosomal protein L11 methyltransferase [Litorimonas sp.]
MAQVWALEVTAPGKDGYALAEALGFDEITEALAVSVFDAEPGMVMVQALYPAQTMASEAQRVVPSSFEGRVRLLPDEDWVALSQSGLPPIRAGRFAVFGSHDSAPEDAAFPILLDAGQAFGTGHHGTTQGCLLMLDHMQREGFQPERILDLGTGAGILAIGAAKLFPAADILATDIDPVAIDVATVNAELNDVRFDRIVADGFDCDGLKDRRFDLVIANILAGPLRGMAPEIANAMVPGGQAILSGILDAQAEWVSGAFEAAGLSVSPRDSIDGWTSLLARK